MKLIDVTNSHPRLVQKQLESTDAQFIKVYSLGKTTVIFTDAPQHTEILLVNKLRNIQSTEVEFVKEYFKRNFKLDLPGNDIEVIHMDGAVELSLKKDLLTN